MGPEPATSESPGNLSQMHILGLQPRPTRAEALGVGLSNPSLTCLLGVSDTYSSLHSGHFQEWVLILKQILPCTADCIRIHLFF